MMTPDLEKVWTYVVPRGLQCVILSSDQSHGPAVVVCEDNVTPLGALQVEESKERESDHRRAVIGMGGLWRGFY